MTGFDSKRNAAQAKLEEDDDDDTQVYSETLLIVYQRGFADGKKAQPEPTCPECKAAVLYECVACSSNNYPPATQPPPEWEAINNIIAEYGLDAIAFVAEWKAAQRPWIGLDEDDIRKLYGKDLNYRDGNYVRYAMAVEAKLKERNT